MRWEEYKGSTRWQGLKWQALCMAEQRCQCGEGIGKRCSNVDHLEMHHDRYPFSLRGRGMQPELDRIENVRILCRDCHKSFHDSYPKCFGNLDTTESIIAFRISASSASCEHPMDETDISDLVGDNK
jgi:hypothetical protein